MLVNNTIKERLTLDIDLTFKIRKAINKNNVTRLRGTGIYTFEGTTCLYYYTDQLAILAKKLHLNISNIKNKQIIHH
jgi:hypothetical protein